MVTTQTNTQLAATPHGTLTPTIGITAVAHAVRPKLKTVGDFTKTVNIYATRLVHATGTIVL